MEIHSSFTNCPYDYEISVECQRPRGGVPAQEGWGNSRKQSSAAHGCPTVGTPTITSSAEPDVDSSMLHVAEKECLGGQYRATICTFPTGKVSARPSKLNGVQCNLVQNIENEIIQSESVHGFRELACYLRDLPPKNELQARALVSGEAKVEPPYGPLIINVWKVQLGESGRGDLKREISERISAFPYLKPTVNAVSKIKTATVDQLVVISEIVGLLKKTLRIAQRYELERTPFIRLLSTKRQHRSRLALNIPTVLPNMSPAHSSVSDEASFHRKVPRTLSSTQAPPPKARRRGCSLTKTVASWVEESPCRTVEHGSSSTDVLTGTECVPHAIVPDSSSPVVNCGVLPSVGDTRVGRLLSSSPGSMARYSVKQNRTLAVAGTPPLCKVVTERSDALIHVAEVRRDRLQTGGDGATLCVPSDGCDTRKGVCRCPSYFFEASVSQRVHARYGMLPSCAVSSFDSVAGTSEDSLPTSVELKTQEIMCSRLAAALEKTDEQSQLMRIIGAAASKLPPSDLRQLQHDRGLSRCACTDLTALVPSCPSSNTEPKAEKHFLTGSILATTSRQSGEKHASQFYDEDRLQDILWKLQAGKLAVTPSKPGIVPEEEASRVNLSAASEPEMVARGFLGRRRDKESQNNAASSIVAVMLQNQRLRMDIKDQQTQAEAFARGILSLFKDLMVQMMTELTSTITSHVEELINEQALRHIRQLAAKEPLSHDAGGTAVGGTAVLISRSTQTDSSHHPCDD